MISLIEYNSKYINYYNSLSSKFNPVILTESALVSNYGKSIDSIVYKLDTCSYRQNSNNFIFENSDDILFTIDEQYAVRDILLLTCKYYVESLCKEYNLYIPINENDENDISSLKNFINKVSNVVKEKTDKVKSELSEVGDKLKAIKDFINKIVSKAIKSAKELAQRFLELMISLKSKLADIFKKLGGKIEEIQNEYAVRIEEVIKNKSKRPKDNIYQDIQEYLNSNNKNQINEFLGFGKKKENNQNNKESNEYEQSLNKNGNNKKSIWKNMWDNKGKILLSILKSIAISVTILIIITALIGCAWGPAAAMIAGTLAKAIMTGYAFWKLLKNIYVTISSGKFKEATKWAKLGYIILWILSIGLLTWGAKKAAGDMVKIWDSFSACNLKQLVPDETIQDAMKIINNIWKSITGKDIPGFEELQKITSSGITEWEKLEETKGKTNDNFTDKQLKNLGDTNDWNNIEQNLGKETMGKLKSVAEAPLKSTKAVQDEFIKAIDPTNIPSDTHVVLLDGNTVSKMARDGLLSSVDGAKVAVNQLTNTALQASTNGQAGTLFMVAIKGSKEAATSLLSNAANTAGSHGVDLVGKMISGTASETITKMIPHSLPVISGGFAPIVTLPTIVKKKVNKGFLLRLGSGRTGNKIYTIKEDGIKEMTFSEVESKYSNMNKDVFNHMKNIINKNYKTLENAKNKLESKGDLNKDNKKLLDAIIKQLEKMKSGIKEYKCLVFYSDKEIKATNTQETNEGFIDKLFGKKEKPEVKKIEYTPVMFINPICMACGDLMNRTDKKGPRKKPIYIKGIFGSYEFLPGAEGMNEKDIDEMLTQISVECLKTAWNMTADAPCIKKGRKKYIENDKSIFKGKERDDFGTFTNTEITEIFNNPSTISKYMSGSYSKRSTVEKENTENQKQRKENAKKEWKNNIENNDEVKKIIDQSPSLKKNLLDDNGKVKDNALNELTNSFLRMETNYNKGNSKKSLWQKIKDFFVGDKDAKEKYDSKEVQNLAYKLASLHAKKLKSKNNKETNESLEELDYNIHCFEMNMQDLLSEEFIYFLNNNEIFESNFDDYIELIQE